METNKSTTWPDALRKQADDLEREAVAARIRGAAPVCVQALEKELARVLDELDEFDRP